MKCPFCGEEKEVLTLESGNTFDGQQWSDARRIYPMLPQVSPIQKCPSCGKYFFTEDAERRHATEGYSFDTGHLTYKELREAAIQYGDELSPQNMASLDMFLLWTFNDEYNREDMEIRQAPKEERDYVDTILDKLIDVFRDSDVFRAEYLRERGRFEEALELLEKCHPEDDYLVDIVEKTKSYAKERNRIAFRIE